MRSSQLRILFVSLLAVFAVGAIASASASAHEYIIEGTPVAAATKVEGTSGASTLQAAGLLTIKCAKDTFKGTIEAEGDSTATVNFKECKVFNAAGTEEEPKCKIEEPGIEFKVIDELTVFKGGPGELFEPASGFTFVTITITGAECVTGIKGAHEVIGKQQCELPEGEVEKVEHNVVCKPEGSELKLGTAEAKFTSTETVKLESGKKWRVKF